MDSTDIDSSNSAFIESGVWELGFVKRDVSDFGVLHIELIIGNESIEIKKKLPTIQMGVWLIRLLIF